MVKDLTSSPVDRQNVLNNPFAIKEIEKSTRIKGIPFEGRSVLLKEQVADFFEVDIRTVERYLAKYSEELALNGYEVIGGKRLNRLKIAINEVFGPDKSVGSKTTTLGIFDFRAFLNMSMLLAESERARVFRQIILDIVIDVINAKTGGGTKYINQRDEDFLTAYFQEENYRKRFTDALRDFVDMGNVKYAIYTNKIYVSIFREEAAEYRKILRLNASEKTRDTFYSEILDIVASYEYGFAEMLKSKFKVVGRKLNSWEVDELFKSFENQPHWVPLINKTRVKIASRDLAFRDALHYQLKKYITPLDSLEFERFLGEKSKELVDRLEEAKDVLKRLKERD